MSAPAKIVVARHPVAPSKEKQGLGFVANHASAITLSDFPGQNEPTYQGRHPLDQTHCRTLDQPWAFVRKAKFVWTFKVASV